MIYQLLKTSPYLSGQVRLDLVADHLEGDPKILLDEVHVVPISDSIWYNCPEDQIQYKHTDNIVSLYKAIEDKFYSVKGDILLRGKYPYYSVHGTECDTVDHTYQMGLRRTSTSRYGKDFSFLLPMWIDSDISDNIEFYITVYPVSNPDNALTTKKLELSERLRAYIREYLYSLDSDLVYIGLRDQTAYLKGLEAGTGTVVTKDISSIVSTLLERERPLIETDNMLCMKLSEYSMVARQLINFNFCFNMRDLFSPNIESTILWNPVNVVVEARVDGEAVETRDIYTNYSDIYSYKISSNPIHPGSFVEGMYRPLMSSDGMEVLDQSGEPVIVETKFNVLDYLQDTKCIDLVHANKMLQPNFHWAFQDNLRYTWNLYNGFSPLVEEDGAVHRIEGRFFGTPDIMSENYEAFRNNLQWITVLDGTGEIVPGSFIGLSMCSRSTTRFKPNQFGTCWSKGIKYNLSDTISKGYGLVEGSNEIRANICVVRDISTDHLDKDKMYCAVCRRLTGPSGSKELIDYISIVAITDGTIEDYWGIDNLTYLGVRGLLDGELYNTTEEEYSEVFNVLGPEDEGEFRALYVIAEKQVEEPEYPDNTLTPATETESYDLVKLFLRVLETVEYPNVIRFQKSLGTRPAPAPSIDKLIENGTMEVQYTTEIEYTCMDEDYSTYLFRYDGKLVPQFIVPELHYTDQEYNGVWWRTLDSGAFNMIYRKRQFSELTQNDKDCLNYISKQKYQPDYPSIGYFYIDGVTQDMDKPFVPEGYYGEICWFKKNLAYFVPKEFSIDAECTSEEMTDEKKLSMFTDYALGRGWFKELSKTDLELATRVIQDYVYRLYSVSSDWEYSSETDIDLYRFRVTYSLR